MRNCHLEINANRIYVNFFFYYFKYNRHHTRVIVKNNEIQIWRGQETPLGTFTANNFLLSHVSKYIDNPVQVKRKICK